jgi:hypothetical protein
MKKGNKNIELHGFLFDFLEECYLPNTPMDEDKSPKAKPRERCFML